RALAPIGRDDLVVLFLDCQRADRAGDRERRHEGLHRENIQRTLARCAALVDSACGVPSGAVRCYGTRRRMDEMSANQAPLRPLLVVTDLIGSLLRYDGAALRADRPALA